MVAVLGTNRIGVSIYVGIVFAALRSVAHI